MTAGFSALNVPAYITKLLFFSVSVYIPVSFFLALITIFQIFKRKHFVSSKFTFIGPQTMARSQKRPCFLIMITSDEKFDLDYIEIINNKARHNLINEKCRWRSDWLDGAWSFREPLDQTKVMQIRQRETQICQRETTHEICCLATQ